MTASRVRDSQDFKDEVTMDNSPCSSLDRDIEEPPLLHLVSERYRVV
jgi:hypothetical protein